MVFIPFIISILLLLRCAGWFYFLGAGSDYRRVGAHCRYYPVPENYQHYFNDEINKRMADWPLISRDVHVELSVAWCDSISTVINHVCTTTDARNKPLAFYNVTTDYQPLFFSFLPKVSSVN